MSQPENGPSELPREPASASVQTRGFHLGSLVAVIVLAAGLLIVGLATRHRSSPPSASPTGPPASPSARPAQDTSSAHLVAFRTFDARGVFFHYPASARPTGSAPRSKLVPEGSSWSAAFRDDAGDVIEVAAYPRANPGTSTGRYGRANAVARELAAPSAFAERTAIHVRATYPSFGYPLDAIHPSGVGFLVFTPRWQFAIGCSAVASAPSGQTRCRYVLDTFRDTSAGVSPATPTVRSAADAVYEAWKSGRLSEAGDDAAQGVLRYLIDSPWTPGSALASCDTVPGSDDTFACTVTEAGTAGKLLVVAPIRGRFVVVGIGECSGDITHGTCYTLRTRDGAFP